MCKTIRRRTGILIVAMAIQGVVVLLCFARSWTDSTGTRSVQAELVKVDVKQLRLVVQTVPSVMSVAFSPGGRQLLTGGSTTARLWDSATGKELRKFAGHTEPVSSVAFSPDGRQVLTGSWDKTARLWQSAFLQLVADSLG